MLKIIKSFFKDELFINNREAAYARNKKTLTIVIAGTIGCYITLLIASFISYAYVAARITYIIAIALFLSILVSVRFLNDKAATVFAYGIHFLFIAYCTYNSAFVWPRDICVMILSEIFIVSTLILDKSWRVIGVTVLSGAIYLAVISPYKAPYHFVDEFVNIVCFTILSCIVGIFTRKTQLKNFDIIEKLRMSQQHYELAMRHSEGVMCEFDVAQRCVLMTSELAKKFDVPEKIYGVPEEIVKNGKISPESSDAYIDFFQEIIRGNENGEAKFETFTSFGWRWQKAHYSTIFDKQGQPVSAVISFTDITQMREEQNKLQKEAKTDGMTGVYNRATSEALVEQMLKLKNDPFAFLIVDVDNLKTINDTLGHPHGDEAIKTLANVLKERSRKNDIVGRIGGDEFIAFLSNIGTKEQIEDKIERLLSSLSKINLGDNKDYPLSASIGIVLGVSGDISFKELYAKADKALYIAKRNGKNQFAFYENN